jgi:hypothetical protein
VHVRVALLAGAAAAAGRGPGPLLALVLAARRAAATARLQPVGVTFVSELMHRAAAQEASPWLETPGDAAALLLAAAELAWGAAPWEPAAPAAAAAGSRPGAAAPAPLPLPPQWLRAVVERLWALAVFDPEGTEMNPAEALGLVAALGAWAPLMAAERQSRPGMHPSRGRRGRPRKPRQGEALRAAAPLREVGAWLRQVLGRHARAGAVAAGEAAAAVAQLERGGA